MAFFKMIGREQGNPSNIVTWTVEDAPDFDGYQAPVSVVDVALSQNFDSFNLLTGGDGSKSLRDDGYYVTAGSGDGYITLIDGDNGVNVINGAGPTVIVDGYNLLPTSGIRPMAGNLNMGGNNIEFSNLIGALSLSGSVEIESPVFRNIGGNNTAIYNGVQLTATEDGYKYLSGGGLYKQVPAEDVSFVPSSGVSATNVQDAIQEVSTLDQYENTFFVDPLGDPNVSGKNPAQPTTLENALANATFSSLILVSEGIFQDADGPGTGTLTIPNSNITFKSLQGGTQSNSALFEDDIIIGTGITRLRMEGIRLDGDINDNGSQGRHFFSGCTTAAKTFTRTNPNNFVVITDCAWGAANIVTTGAGTNASFNISGSSTTMGTINCGSTNTSIELNGLRSLGRVTLTDGNLIARESLIIDPTLAIDATGSSAVYLNTVSCLDTTGAPVPINAPTISFHNAIFDFSNSTIGANISEYSEFGNAVHTTTFASNGGTNDATFNGVQLSTTAGASNYLAGDGTYKAISVGPGAGTLAETLDNGNTTDGYNIDLTSGSVITSTGTSLSLNTSESVSISGSSILMSGGSLATLLSSNILESALSNITHQSPTITSSIVGNGDALVLNSTTSLSKDDGYVFTWNGLENEYIPLSAENVSYDNSQSMDLNSDNVQDAIDELDGYLQNISSLEYVVSPPGSVSTRTLYTNIQDAVDACEASGMSGVVVVEPGSYTENITISKPGVNLRGLTTRAQAQTLITGSLTYSVDAESYVSFKGFNLNGSVFIQGSNTTILYISDVEIDVNSGSNAGIDCTNTSSSTTVVIDGNVRVTQSGSAPVIRSTTNNRFDAESCRLVKSDISQNAIEASDDLILRNVEVQGQTVWSGNAAFGCTIRGAATDMVALGPALTISGSGSALITGAYMVNALNGAIISGSTPANLTFSNIQTPVGFGQFDTSYGTRMSSDGVVLDSNGAGNSFLADDGTYKAAVTSPGSPDFSLQFNNSGSFGGNAGLTVEFDSTGARQIFASPNSTASATGIRINDSSSSLKGEVVYDENADAMILAASSGNVSIAGGNQIFMSATTGPIVISSAGVTIDAGVPMSWPTSDGDDGYVLSTDGMGGLSFEPTGDFLLRDGSLPMTGTLNMDGNSILNVNGLFASVVEASSFTSVGGGNIATFNGVQLTATGSATDFLNAEGNYVSVSGSGDVVGPASATDNAIARFDTATGKLLQDSSSIVIPFADSTDSQINLNGTVNAFIQATNAPLTVQNVVFPETFSDSFTFPNSDGDDGYVLTTDGNGNLGFEKTAPTRNTPTTIKTANYFAGSFETVRYNPTGGTFTIFAPSVPQEGDRFTVKNYSGSVNTITINGNGSNIEDPLNTFALAATVSGFGGDGISATWEYNFGDWLVV